MLISVSQLFAEASGQNKRVSLKLENQSLIKLMDVVQKKTGYSFIYSAKDIERVKEISIEEDNALLKDVLDKVFEGTGLGYVFESNLIIVRKKSSVLEQKTVTVKGKVRDKDGNSLPGVSIVIKGTSVGVSSDMDGNFKIQASKGDVLIFSFIGMASEKVVIKDQSFLKIVLKESNKELDEVVVNGYFKKSKESFTGSVKTVKSEEILAVSNQNVLAAISALEPSFVMTEDNIAGSDPNRIPEFTLRGSSNLNNLVDENRNNPNMPLFILDGFETTANIIFDLDPYKVENITILKDASATAIYGSKAANGVVVVNTKKPKKGKLNIAIRTDCNFEVPDLSAYNLLNAKEKLEYELLAGVYEDERDGDYYPSIEAKNKLYNQRLGFVNRGIDTDWLNKPLNEVSVGLKESVSIEGGDNTFRYGLNISNEDKKGVMKQSGRKRSHFSINLQYVNKNLSFRNSFNYSRVKAYNSPYGNFRTYADLNPYFQYLDDNGDYIRLFETITDGYGKVSGQTFNPLFDGELKSINERMDEILRDNFEINWAITDYMTFKIQTSVQKTRSSNDRYISNKHSSFYNLSEEEFFMAGRYTKGYIDELSYSINGIYTYLKTINDHTISLNCGCEIQEDEDYSLIYDVEGVTEAECDPSLAISYQRGTIPSGSENKVRRFGCFANTNYAYKNKYLVDFSYRCDASSIYGANNRWGGFWSLGLGWNIHNELKTKDSFINNLKIRGSIGTTGSQNFSSYQAIRTYQRIKKRRYNIDMGYDIMNLDNPNLKWVSNLKYNAGIDFALFHNRIIGNLEYYVENSKNSLIPISMAPSSGFGSFIGNLGEVRNLGLEFSINSTIIKNEENNFRVNCYFSAVKNKNVINKLADNLISLSEKGTTSSNGITPVRYIEGKSMNILWVVPSLGIDPVSGKELFLKKNGDTTFEWSNDDLIPYKNSDPKFNGSFGTSINYKGLQLNAAFSYKIGGYIYNSTLASRVEDANPRKNVDRRALKDAWNKPGDIARFEKPDFSNSQATSRFIEEEYYLKCNSINLCYRIPKSNLQKSTFKACSVTFYMNDLFTLSTVKQERGISYPFARNYSLSLNVAF
jgi:TonB-linked SusC/RagA family outer membrane protein